MTEPIRGRGERVAIVARSFGVALTLALLAHAPVAAVPGPGRSAPGAADPEQSYLARQGATPSDDTVAGQLLAHSELGTFAQLVEEAGLLEIFSGPGPMTLFAPTDVAFEPYRDGQLEDLRSRPRVLERFIRYHLIDNDIIVVPGGRLTENGSLNPIDRVLYWPLE